MPSTSRRPDKGLWRERHAESRCRRIVEDELARGLHLIEAANRHIVGRRAYDLWIVARLDRDLAHRLNECIEHRLALGFRRLDHQRLAHDERKIIRWRMEAVVHEPLADIERPHGAALDVPLANELVHVDTVIGNREQVLEAGAKIIGVEDRMHGAVAQPVGTEQADIRVGADQHAEVAEERGDAPD